MTPQFQIALGALIIASLFVALFIWGARMIGLKAVACVYLGIGGLGLVVGVATTLIIQGLSRL